METYEAPIPERAWGGRPWIATCCGGCCLVYVVVMIGLFFLIKRLVGFEQLPSVADVVNLFTL